MILPYTVRNLTSLQNVTSHQLMSGFMMLEALTLGAKQHTLKGATEKQEFRRTLCHA